MDQKEYCLKYMKDLYRSRKQSGICCRCGINTKYNDFINCLECINKEKERRKLNASAKSNKGTCTRCSNLAESPYKFCSQCREKAFNIRNTKQYREYKNIHDKNRKKIDMGYKISCNLRSRLRAALKNNQKTGSAISDLGCSIDNLKIHLENQFSDGMSWDNYGFGKDKWCIDHIIPISSFDLTNREQFLIACNYKNLRPMWFRDNIIKGKRIQNII